MSARRYREVHNHTEVDVRFDDETPQSKWPVTLQLTNVREGSLFLHNLQTAWLTTAEARAVAAALIASADEADADLAKEQQPMEPMR